MFGHQGELFDPSTNPQDPEGKYDAQLRFPEPIAGPAPALTRIRKRDGREEPFDKAKITLSIRRAAESVGDRDPYRAEYVATGVAIYLAKATRGSIPTVDDVSAAVEMVLNELGHTPVAFAYRQYREKRNRARELSRDVAGERSRETGATSPDAHEGAGLDSIWVRTSEDALMVWDPERIVAALVRETGMPSELARGIASEVQQIIVNCGLKTLTASLIRELVDAKLIERGYETYRRRHMRLGVPLFDAERIICVPNSGESLVPANPETTDLKIAERVKKEFAFTCVFSEHEADAHIRGDIFIHHLGYVDRLHSFRVLLAHIIRYGISELPFGRVCKPPRHADSFLTQSARLADILRPYCSERIVWENAFGYAAPFAADFGDLALERFLRSFLLGLRSESAQQGVPKTEIEIPGHVSRFFVERVAEEFDKTPALIEETLSRMSVAAFRVLSDGEGTLTPATDWFPVFCLGASSFRTAQGREFLGTLVDEILGLRRKERHKPGSSRFVDIIFSREDDLFMEDNEFCVKLPCLEEVSLNLPRAAYRAKQESRLYDEIQGILDIVGRAYHAKRAFIKRLLSAGPQGPLQFLTQQWEAKPLFLPEKAICRVGLVGLNECVQVLCGYQIQEHPHAHELAVRITRYIAAYCAEMGEQLDLFLEPVCTWDESLAGRFARLDLKAFPKEARHYVKNDPVTHDLSYTPGGGLAKEAQVTPFEKVRLESEIYMGFRLPETIQVRLPEEEVNPDSLVAFLYKVFSDTPVRRLRIQVP